MFILSVISVQVCSTLELGRWPKSPSTCASCLPAFSIQLPAIYQHSVEDYSLRYTEFLRDGDSKAHKLIVEAEVYGDKAVILLECLGHVQKHMSSHHQKEAKSETTWWSQVNWGYWTAYIKYSKQASSVLRQSNPKQHLWCSPDATWRHDHLASFAIDRRKSTMTCAPLESIPAVVIKRI